MAVPVHRHGVSEQVPLQGCGMTAMQCPVQASVPQRRLIRSGLTTTASLLSRDSLLNQLL